VQEAAARLLYGSCRCEALRTGLLAAGLVPVALQALRRHGSQVDVSAIYKLCCIISDDQSDDLTVTSVSLFTCYCEAGAVTYR
jgi:hypothetical protein